jgi:heme/copper-type cytochrome/quinol oxidase subunit 3
MSKQNYPFIAAGVGLLLLLIVLKGSEPRADGTTTLPLFTLLAISEVAFFATAIGAYLGIRRMRAGGTRVTYALIVLSCVMLAVGSLLAGIMLWPK